MSQQASQDWTDAGVKRLSSMLTQTGETKSTTADAEAGSSSGATPYRQPAFVVNNRPVLKQIDTDPPRPDAASICLATEAHPVSEVRAPDAPNHTANYTATKRQHQVSIKATVQEKISNQLNKLLYLDAANEQKNQVQI